MTVALLVLAAQSFSAPAWAAAPKAPVITEPAAAGQIVSAADVHMETAPLQDGDGNGHSCSDWEIWATGPAERAWFASCAEGPEKVHVHLGNGSFENSHAGRTSLLPDRDYELRVRHRDDSGEWSSYSTRLFRTDNERDPLPGAPQWIVGEAGYVVEEVATGFQLPVNIAPVPSYGHDTAQPMLYVAELYGQIKVIKGDLSIGTYASGLLNFDPTGQFPGNGEMGLTGLVVEPATGDVFASMVYEADGKPYPKVVRLHSTDGGLTADTQTTILDMPDEAQAPSHQISNLTIGPDGKLYIHVGDGYDAKRARNLESFQGKILRVNVDGSVPKDNPFYKSSDGITARDYVYAYGFRNPFGGAWRQADGRHYEVENGPSVDRLVRVSAGADYGWDGSDASMRKNARYVWEPSHAPVNIDFVERDRFHASGFPEAKHGHAFVSESGPTYASGPQSRGKRIVEFSFDSDGSVSAPKTLVSYNGSGKSSVAGLASGPGGLYFTGLYPDDPAAGPTGADAKVYRVRYDPDSTASPDTPTVYQERDFQGTAQSLAPGLYEAVRGQLGVVGNDSISSLRVPAGYRVVVCAHDSQGRKDTGDLGLCRYYGPGLHDYVGDDLNDGISLVAAMTGPSTGRALTAYRSRDLAGKTSSFGVGLSEAMFGELGPVGNDAISSLKLGSGRRAVVCAHDSLDRTNTGDLGLCRFYGPGSHTWMGPELDDQISLVAVSP
ncbi:MAG TPA: hypothetical protein DGT23_17635 [Micromonosporaceae bacterium]|nr:hypothetical protein [Micromonosporaceae bacterium]